MAPSGVFLCKQCFFVNSAFFTEPLCEYLLDLPSKLNVYPSSFTKLISKPHSDSLLHCTTSGQKLNGYL